MDAFGGRPVWLASLSRRDSRGIVATGVWVFRSALRKEAEAFLRRALHGVGDERYERLFRMNVTLCLHRALSAEEAAGLPESFGTAPGGLAGGPVEVLSSRGIPEDLAAAKVCRSPGRIVIDASRPDLWIPEDCGECPPCKARAAIEGQIARAGAG